MYQTVFVLIFSFTLQTLGQGYMGSQSGGATCRKSNPDLSQFPADWGNAVIKRLRAEDVELKNGNVPASSGFADKLTGLASKWAGEIEGCKEAGVAEGSENAVFFATALLATISCYESNWIPTTKFDEKQAGGIKGCSSGSKTCNESRGLLQMTIDSDKDSKNGCALNAQSDLDDPKLNLMCGLAKMAKMKPDNVKGLSKYWSVIKKFWPKISKTMAKECQAGFDNIKNYETQANATSTTWSGGKTYYNGTN